MGVLVDPRSDPERCDECSEKYLRERQYAQTGRVREKAPERAMISMYDCLTDDQNDEIAATEYGGLNDVRW